MDLSWFLELVEKWLRGAGSTLLGFFFFCLLGEVGVGLKAAATPSQLSWPALCQEGRESGTAIVCLYKCPSVCVWPDRCGWEGSRLGRGYLGLRGSSQILVPMA